MLIYKVTNKLNNKIYIGQTCRLIKQRWKEHCKPSLKTRSYLSAAINKYGAENFEIEILIKCDTQKELDFQEDRLIKKI